MDMRVLYEEGYKKDFNNPSSPYFFHIDYFTKYYDSNMKFQHFHPFYEMYMLVEGTANHIIEGKLFPIRAFDIILLNKNLLHKTYYEKDNPCKRIIINFSCDGLLPLFNESMDKLFSIFTQQVPIFRFTLPIQEELIRKFNDLFTLSKTSYAANMLRINNIYIDILYLIYDNTDKNIYATNSSSAPIVQKMHTIASFIHTNYYKPLSLQSIAEDFFISPYYLSHQFKGVIGFNIVEYIQLTRLRSAQQLLLNTNMKIIDISQICGFGSVSQFNRVFNNFCQSSPSSYRKKDNGSF